MWNRKKTLRESFSLKLPAKRPQLTYLPPSFNYRLVWFKKQIFFFLLFQDTGEGKDITVAMRLAGTIVYGYDENRK